ncbi:MAG: hypothetical protein KDB27_07480 [Planctomycetales bacterium]|nr:hypothetical protein [Planctomycetales bacterium]
MRLERELIAWSLAIFWAANAPLDSFAQQAGQGMIDWTMPSFSSNYQWSDNSAIDTTTLWVTDHTGAVADANANGEDQVIARGKAAFEASCTDCHEAERSLDKRKTSAGWLKTVREMASMDDADIDEADIMPIVAYLASLGPPTKTEASEDSEESHDDMMSDSSKKSSSGSSGADKQTIEQGRSAFQSSCVKCHDADRSLQKKKSKSAWLSTVRRMATMDDAEVKQADIVPIATYLASLNESNGGDGEGSATDESDGALGSALSLGGTFSAQFRGGNDNLETPGFFPDIWVTADWQPTGPLRGRITVCTSCHSDQTDGGGFTFEIVESVASLDLLHWFKEKDRRPEHCRLGVQAELKAGRFSVPFGAFAGISHPGSYHTVSNPLIYAMGRQVAPVRNRPPVLPMPYSDEGADISVKIPLTEKINATLDAYAVNGLQGSGAGVNFTRSRAYTDNNSQVGVGGRATIGGSKLRFGGSIMAGEMQDDGAVDKRNYRLAGGDVTGRFLENQLRTYFEYAIRQNDSPFPDDQIVFGTVTEVEALLLDKPNLSLLGRYDTTEYRDGFGHDSVSRFTWGLSTTSIAGSLLMLNHERWHILSPDSEDVDVIGIRWVTAF